MGFTIVDSVINHAASNPDAVAFRYIANFEEAPIELTYKDLFSRANDVAQFLKGSTAVGSRVMLFFPPGLDYVISFFGCLLAGMVAVPLYPPRRNSKSDRIFKVAQSCQSTIALTVRADLNTIQALWAEQNAANIELNFFATDTLSVIPEGSYLRANIDENSPAFFQYTSGSTGTPKGVVITHKNIIANLQHLSLMSTGNKDDIFVNWLPLFHDLGLITAVLWPVFLGAPSTLMAPATFVRNPVNWLRAISLYRGSMCGAPNFAYELCVNKVSDEEMKSLDLSSWRVAYNAAEPVKAKTIKDFSNKFTATGFNTTAFYPSYGMAEATVLISGGKYNVPPIILSVDKKLLAEGALMQIDGSDTDATEIVACGNALPPHDIKIVDPESGVALEDGKVGEIWFSGPSVSSGYWGLPDVSAETFNQHLRNLALGDPDNAAYLRTGDLGLLWNGELFVTGRMKDLIIFHGRNFYPQDIESSAAGAHASIRPGAVAAFSIKTIDETEKLILAAEIEREYLRSIDPGQVQNTIRQQVLLDHEVIIDEVILMKPYKIPMTSSGKIQRNRTKTLYENGELESILQNVNVNVKARQKVNPVLSKVGLVLHDMWCRTLKRDGIGADENFFELGGNSLSAIELISDIRNAFPNVVIDTQELFELPTLEALSAYIELQLAHQEAKKSSTNAEKKRSIKI